MNILALDPASRTGFCFGGAPGTGLMFGVWAIGSDPSRTGVFRRKLKGILDQFPDCQAIAYELAAMGARGFHAVHKHAELAGIIKEVADERRIPCWGFHIGTWKAIALGSGRATPAQYTQLLERHYGHVVSSADEAAAIAIWYAAQKGPPPASVKKRAKAVKKQLAKKQAKLF